jgi:hypothetical protein
MADAFGMSDFVALARAIAARSQWLHRDSARAEAPAENRPWRPPSPPAGALGQSERDRLIRQSERLMPEGKRFDVDSLSEAEFEQMQRFIEE